MYCPGMSSQIQIEKPLPDNPHNGPATRAIRKAATEGRPHGRIPFGYRAAELWSPLGGYEKHRTPDPTEAPVVKELFARIASGDSLASVLHNFTDRGITRRDGKSLTRPSAIAILKNPTYAGYRTHQGRVISEGRQEALVSEDTYLAVREILADLDRQKTPDGNKPKYLLSGLAACGVCGQRMKHIHYPRGETRYDSYRCYVRGDHSIGRAVEFMDRVVLAELMELTQTTTGPADPLFELARVPEAKRRDYWDRLPLSARREFIRQGLDIVIKPVGKGQHRSTEGYSITRKVSASTQAR